MGPLKDEPLENGAATNLSDMPVTEPSTSGRVSSSSLAGSSSGDDVAIEKAASKDLVGLSHRSIAIPLPADEPVDLMERVEPEKQLELRFHQVSAWVPMLFGAPSGLSKSVTFARSLTLSSAQRAQSTKGKRDSQKGSMRQILYSITGTCMPGEVLALMGPSGSGKTSLLSILGGRVPKGAMVDGAPLFNGVKLTKRAKRQVGFVLQDDLLYESLTVYETLYYAAMLRLPRTMSAEEKVARVDSVVDSLGLRKCKDTIIGGFFRRGISGGERKRVSVGHELLINPSVLLLDEPTSGLDSTTAMRLVTTLRHLAKGGRAIISTIHQPSSRLFQQLDKLLLLSEGHAMYYGQAHKAADWFHHLGFTMPYGVNAADFILDLASADVRTEKLEGEEAREHLIECYEQYAIQNPQFDGYREGQELSERVMGSGLWAAARTRSRGSTQIDVVVDKQAEPLAEGKLGDDGAGEPQVRSTKLLSESRWGASYWTQLSVLFTRSVRNRRFETLSKQDILQFLLVGAICGMFWWQIGQYDTVVGASNTNGLIFFEMLFLGFRSMFVALFTFPSEFKMMLKERASGMYRLSAFYFARTASDLPMEFSVPVVFIVIVYFMAGLRLTPAAFFGNLFVTLLVTAVAQSCGLLIGATVMNTKSAQTIASVVMLTMMLVGGFYVNAIPVWIAWAKYLSFIYYGYNLLLKVEYSGRTLWNCNGLNPPNPETDPRCTVVPPGGLQPLLHLQENTENWPWEILVLLGFVFVLRAAVYVSLRRKTSTSKQ